MLKQKMHGKPLVYLDSAATAQKPQVVIDAIADFYSKTYGTVHRAVYELSAGSTEAYEVVRYKVQHLLHAAKSNEIIFTRGTTDGINLVAASFGKAFVKKGDEILITESEHHSNIVPWQLLCQATGALLKVVKIDDNAEIDLDHFEELLNDRTKLVAISHIANSSGTIHPIKYLINRAHEYGAVVLVDGAQSAPHMLVNVQDLDADFFVFSGHKFYGPTGIGILYGKQEVLDAMPPYQGGGDMVKVVSFEHTEYNSLPLKFEAGTPPIAEVIGLGSAIDYVQAIGLEHIQKYEQELFAYANEKIADIPGLQLIGTAQEKAPIISFTVEGLHHLDIGTLLDLRGVAIRTGNHCAQPTMKRFGVTGTCRASLAFYNSLEDVDRFILSLKEVISLLRK